MSDRFASMVYLDHNATTPLAPEALQAMLPYLEEYYGNASSIHASGREARAAIDDARDRLARLLGTKSHEIIFTGGGTESDNLAILGLARRHADKGRHLITCATEHHAVLHAFESLEKREGFRVTVLQVESDGRLDPELLRDAITRETILVSIMTANNETGIRHPACALAGICRERGVLMHTDAIQTFGKEPLDVLAFDAVTLAAHKFNGPKGAGILWVRAGVSLDRIAHGGSHEGERRPGTENVAAIAGMACAAEIALSDFQTERIATLRDVLWDGVREAYPNAVRHGSASNCLPNTLNVSFPGADGEGLLIALDLAGVAVSSGSACMVGSIQPSHVLLAMGVPAELAQATVRFSLGKPTTAADIEDAIERMTPVLRRIKENSDAV